MRPCRGEGSAEKWRHDVGEGDGSETSKEWRPRKRGWSFLFLVRIVTGYDRHQLLATLDLKSTDRWKICTDIYAPLCEDATASSKTARQELFYGIRTETSVLYSLPIQLCLVSYFCAPKPSRFRIDKRLLSEKQPLHPRLRFLIVVRCLGLMRSGAEFEPKSILEAFIPSQTKTLWRTIY